jgi:hypothetical protein
MGEVRSGYQIFGFWFENLRERESLRICSHIWKDNIKMNFAYIEYEVVN